jgi:hypothetical protein
MTNLSRPDIHGDVLLGHLSPEDRAAVRRIEDDLGQAEQLIERLRGHRDDLRRRRRFLHGLPDAPSTREHPWVEDDLHTTNPRLQPLVRKLLTLTRPCDQVHLDDVCLVLWGVEQYTGKLDDRIKSVLKKANQFLEKRGGRRLRRRRSTLVWE